MGWHDDERNSTGALTTRLAIDAGEVQGVSLLNVVLSIVDACMYMNKSFMFSRECNALWGEPVRTIEVCCRLSSTVEDSEFAKNVPIFTVSGLCNRRED